MKKVALIMAGGRGERFWPMSRAQMPKQFLKLTGEKKSLIQLTVERVEKHIDIKDIYISTHSSYRTMILQQLPHLPEENIICEPASRNTAACIGLAAIFISHKYQDAVMTVMPSDHLIKNKVAFWGTLQTAYEIALEDNNLITIGITPTRPDTGYGYLKTDELSYNRGAFKVVKFYEKPDFRTAQEYVASDQYLWNSGIFVWKTSSILSSIERYLPDTYIRLKRIREAMNTPDYDVILEREYSQLPSISIDYGVMEKASHIYAIPGSFYWDDIGSWRALDRVNVQDSEGNVIFGNFVALNTKNCILNGREKLIAIIGASQLIVVDTEDAMLICHKDSVGDIKTALRILKDSGRSEYL